MTSPAPLSPDAQAKWDQLVAVLSTRESWSDGDIHALYVLATSLAQYEFAETQIAEQGSVVLTASGAAVKNPYCTIQNQAWDRCSKLFAAFGLTPAGRSAIGQTDAKPPSLKDLMKRKVPPPLPPVPHA